jgi:hypothetical protein
LALQELLERYIGLGKFNFKDTAISIIIPPVKKEVVQKGMIIFRKKNRFFRIFLLYLK